jgi:hypothetical protein
MRHSCNDKQNATLLPLTKNASQNMLLHAQKAQNSTQHLRHAALLHAGGRKTLFASISSLAGTTLVLVCCLWWWVMTAVAIVAMGGSHRKAQLYWLMSSL